DLWNLDGGRHGACLRLLRPDAYAETVLGAGRATSPLGLPLPSDLPSDLPSGLPSGLPLLPSPSAFSGAGGAPMARVRMDSCSALWRVLEPVAGEALASR